MQSFQTLNNMNYYFVNQNELFSGRVNATNPQNSTIMGAEVITGKDLIMYCERTMSIPYAFINVDDAIKRLLQQVAEQKFLLEYLLHQANKIARTQYAVIDNSIVPVSLLPDGSNEGGMHSAHFVNNESLDNISVHIDELFPSVKDAIHALKNKVC